MKRIACLITAMALAAAAATAFAGQPQQAKPITGQGCVESGVEAKCLVVKDVASGVLYNLVIHGTQPEIGEGIEFTGTPYNGMTTCMQGTPVRVAKWSRMDSLQCVAGQTPKP